MPVGPIGVVLLDTKVDDEVDEAPVGPTEVEDTVLLYPYVEDGEEEAPVGPTGLEYVVLL